MDLVKIGKFIATRRKEKKITQEQLAEKLYITDRAVSKWERGLSLPDADKMLDLCNILDINVNELLIGEKIDMKEKDKKTEELLIEMARQEEVNNKKLMTNMWVIGITSMIFYIGIVLISSFTLGEGVPFGIIMVLSTMLLCIAMFYAFSIEVNTGYYSCHNCGHKFKTTYIRAFIAPHMATTRYLKCPKCNKRSWAKKVMTKD